MPRQIDSIADIDLSNSEYSAIDWSPIDSLFFDDDFSNTSNLNSSVFSLYDYNPSSDSALYRDSAFTALNNILFILDDWDSAYFTLVEDHTFVSSISRSFKFKLNQNLITLLEYLVMRPERFSNILPQWYRDSLDKHSDTIVAIRNIIRNNNSVSPSNVEIPIHELPEVYLVFSLGTDSLGDMIIRVEIEDKESDLSTKDMTMIFDITSRREKEVELLASRLEDLLSESFEHLHVFSDIHEEHDDIEAVVTYEQEAIVGLF